ncbi:MAG: caspase family protein [Planctomycetaceae bacterium]|nr:caspase family protein [Planctomycetaceae bacterium]
MQTLVRQLAFWVVLLAVARGASGGQKLAIVVGVNDSPRFRLATGARPRPLAGAERDAAALAELLRLKFGFAPADVQLLTGQAATLEAVRGALARVRGQATAADDQVVFYFSGHGTQLTDRVPLDEPDELDEALCLFDAEASGANMLVDDELGRWLDALPCRRVTVVLDCCHAGTGTKDADDEIVARFLPGAAQGDAARPLRDPPAGRWIELNGGQKSLDRQRTAWFACQAEQQAYERRLDSGQTAQRRGQFSYYLVEAFATPAADRDGNGTITNREAFAYVAARLDETFNRLRSAARDRQQPALEADRPEESPF